MVSIFDGLINDTDFFFVRHGESEGNREGRIQGRTDYSLTSKGLEHARLTGEWLSPQGIDAIFTSPLIRARQTALAIMDGAGLGHLQPQQVPELIEIDTGSFSNRRFRDIAIEEPETYQDFHARSWSAVPGAESIVTVQERAKKHWATLILAANAGAKKLLSISHFGCIQCLVKATFGGHIDWLPLLSIGNCGVFHIYVSPRTSSLGLTYFSEWRLLNYPAWQQK
jgi:broad specificity phosphatase PhoE